MLFLFPPLSPHPPVHSLTHNTVSTDHSPRPPPLLRREQRYLKDPDPFDWYQRYSNNPHLRNLIDKAVPRAAAVLVPGSGSSRLSEDMLADGYTGGISNIDISRTAIDLMADRCKDRAGLTCAWGRAAWLGMGVAVVGPTRRGRVHARQAVNIFPWAAVLLLWRCTTTSLGPCTLHTLLTRPPHTPTPQHAHCMRACRRASDELLLHGLPRCLL